MPYPPWTPVKGLTPLTSSESAELAATLPVTPHYVIPYAGLRHGLDRVFAAGSRTNPDAVVMEHRGTPGEPEFFGPDPEAGWSLLSRIPGWFCLNGTRDDMARFRPILAREVPAPFEVLGDVFFTLDGPPIPHPNPAVRLLGPADIPLLQDFGPPVWGNSYRTFDEMVTTGVVAAAIVEDRPVSVALVSAANGRYADVGVHTLAPYRRQGFSSAAASLVATEVRARGLVPIWSTGSNNLASQRVAVKVGFQPYPPCEYLVCEALKQGGGFRPA
ncbi:MAG: GNAT family N-acetyltransferase [Thermoplasmata archaeon]